MCHYCGCRQIPLIIDYIAEHDAALAIGADAVVALERDDLDAARVLLDQLAQNLRSHWRGEEEGIFAAMSADAAYADYISTLVREHRELDALLTRADLGDQQDRDAILVAIAELSAHIRKEEDGLFPASLTTLDGEAWNQSIQAWQLAHPGAVLQTEGS